MEFKLSFPIPAFEKQIRPDSKLFFAGSCFSENIAALFSRYKFRVENNTHGILYNPMSIGRSMQECIHKTVYTEQLIFHANETWNSFQHHSRFSHPDVQQCLSTINQHIVAGHQALKECDLVFITFGSAYTYRHKASDHLAGNCHKLPQAEFTKELLTKDDITGRYDRLIRDIRAINPGATILFTVSPVRYVRDGVPENNLSKAILLQAVHQLVADNRNCAYFPAYEIVMDELRDYRFFEEDFVHPNHTAIRYVWHRLMDSSFSTTTKEYVAELEKLLRAIEHRPFNTETMAHQKFRSSTLQKLHDFETRFPHADLSKEKNF